MNIEDIKQIMDGFDPAALLPDLTTVAGKISLICRIAVLLGPILLLGLGLIYFLIPPKEANHRFGYRCHFGMGSVEAWRFTQRLAGVVWSALGLILTVVMLLVILGFGKLNVVDQVWRAVACMGWELGLVAVSALGINTLTALYYDEDGQLRPNAPKLAWRLKK